MRVRSVRADQDAGPKSSVRGLALLVASLLATASVATAQAAQVTFPKDNPKVTMEVPDGWDVTYNAFGLQIVSPEKDLVILADLLPRKKAEADGWAIQAEGKLGAFGVSFKPEHAAKPRPAVASDAKMPDAKTSELKTSEIKTSDTKTPPATPPASPSVADTKPTVSADKPALEAVAGGAPAAASITPPKGAAETGPNAVVAAVPAAPVASSPAAREPAAEPAATGAPAATPSLSSPSASADSSLSIGVSPSNASAANDAATAIPGAPADNASIDRAAPTFTFMTPPTKIEDPPAPPAAAAYFGSPSLDTPVNPSLATAVRPDIAQGFALDKADHLSSDRPKIPFASGRLPSATMNGQPVDVQIVNFSISKSQLFLMIQASGPTDNRAVAILLSVKRAG